MEFLLQHDWGGSETEEEFLDEGALEQCCLHRIVSGVFRDPLVDEHPETTDDVQRNMQFDNLFNKGFKIKSQKINNKKNFKSDFVPGLRAVPRYPRLSSLSAGQHVLGVKVLADSDPTTDNFACGHPVRNDRKVFADIQLLYKKEQKEYIEWAKRQWVDGQCIRALRPRPIIERVHEAERALRIAAASSLPVTYEYAAQILLRSNHDDYELNHKEDLSPVDLSQLPQVSLPVLNQSRSVLSNEIIPHIPQVCARHPCHILLPNEKKPCELSLKEVHRELCLYANEREAECIVSEAALRCLVQRDKQWTLPVAVQEVKGRDGHLRRVVCAGGEVCGAGIKQPTRLRTARALHLLLRHTITQNNYNAEPEKSGADEEAEGAGETVEGEAQDSSNTVMEGRVSVDNGDASSSDEEDNLCIDIGEAERKSADVDNQERQIDSSGDTDESILATQQPTATLLRQLDACTCIGTPLVKTASRSYAKWQALKKSSQHSFNIIVHCAHKHVKDSDTEVVLNAIPEFQLDLGGSARSAGNLRRCALALMLRKKSLLLTSRIDATNGNIVTYEWSTLAELESRSGKTDGEMAAECADTVHTVLEKLRQLLPGDYLLHHEPAHGDNALLFVSRGRPTPPNVGTLSLAQSEEVEAEGAAGAREAAEEARQLQAPPVLCDVLLPSHKLRKILPLAFSPHQMHLKEAPPAGNALKKPLAGGKRKKNWKNKQKSKQKKMTNKTVLQ